MKIYSRFSRLSRLAAAAILPAILMTGGCGFLAASVDVDAAISEAADVNLANVRAATIDSDNAHRRAAEKLEAALTERIAASSGGAAAAAILEGYRKQKAVLERARALERDRYATVVDNAELIRELINRRIALRARWDALAGRLPAIAHLRAVAEVESRRWIETVGKNTRSEP